MIYLVNLFLLIFTYIVYLFSRVYLPVFSREIILKFLAQYIFSIKKTEVKKMSESFQNFKNINDFFIRNINLSTRRLGKNFIVSPCDGELKDNNKIKNNMLTQVKGIDYSLFSLVLDKNIVKLFKEGYFFNFYLSPKDYHRFHSPCDGEIVKIKYIPGMCLPVNSLGQKISGLYTRNERYIIHIKNKDFNLCFVAIGATAVKKITIHNNNKKTIKKGEEIGFFNLGSSIVILLDKNGFEKISELKIKEGLVKVRENIF